VRYTTLIDTNVLLDLLTEDPRWTGWSIGQIDIAASRGRLAINEIVYAELSVRFAKNELYDAVLDDTGLTFLPIPRTALFLAGKAFGSYRAAGGNRTNVLPDFFIGAHAAVTGATLLTRDARHYRTYFPTVFLATP
jgi:predicted nucleic acid-binding protein